MSDEREKELGLAIHHRQVIGPNGVDGFRAGYDAAQSNAEATIDEAYRERNCLVAFLASRYPSGIRRTDIPGWDAEWHGCVFIDTPEGQMSWHYHDREAQLFAHLPAYEKPWDAHSTPEKYERLRRLTMSDKAEATIAELRQRVLELEARLLSRSEAYDD